jgi:polyhydroxybutyrate depolymerase
MFAYRLACESSTFAAVGPVAATVLGSCETPAPTSVIHIHGSADQAVRLDGARGGGVAHIDGPPVADVIASWRAADGCGAATVATVGGVTTDLADCPHGRAVELITIAGAGHQWPGGAGRTTAERILGLDPPSRALDATTTIWRFFAAHPKA